MEYPSSLLWKPTEQIPAAIRLRVAALCLAIDYGFCKGIPLTQAECEPFNRRSTKYPDGWINPHEFVNWESTGNVLIAEREMLDRLVMAIKSKEITPLHMLMNIDGLIDADKTWIDLNDISEWSDVRGLEFPGDLLGAYFDVERELLDDIESHANLARGFKEYPDADNPDGGVVVDELVSSREKKIDQQKEGYLLPQKTVAASIDNQEKPLLERERNTLLAIIATLCVAAKVDYKHHAKAAGYIKVEAEKMGINIGESTIEGKLKLLPDVIERKSK
jgi:hypothetical protein